MGIIKNNQILKKGFTLIEMTLVVAVFSILIVVTAEVFISFYQISVKTAASRDLGQNLRYSMETITREIRFAEKLEPYVSDKTLYGLDAESAKYIPSDWTTDKAGEIKILTREGKNVLFYCKDDSGVKCSEAKPGSLWQKIDSDVAIKITPDNLSIIEYQILADGTVSEGNAFSIQPKVTIFVRAKSGVPDRAGDYPTISIKNTISKRNYHDLSYCGLTGCGFGIPTINSTHYHTLAVKPDGTAWLWGHQLNTARPVADYNGNHYLKDITDVAAGRGNSLALDSSGDVWSWGYGDSGELGDGQAIRIGAWRSEPQRVVHQDYPESDYLSSITKISAGNKVGYAIDSNNYLWGWGWGQTSTPINILSYMSVVDVSAGITNDSYSSGTQLVATQGGGVYSWSGLNGPSTRISGPGGVGYLSGIVSVSAGGVHSVALKNDGTVWVWGPRNQLGDGQSGWGSPATPVQVKTSDGVGLQDIVQIKAGLDHTLALKSDGTVWAWGGNYRRQLGVGSGSNTVYWATQVRKSYEEPENYLQDIINITAGDRFSAAVSENGEVFSWGFNYDTGTGGPIFAVYRLGNGGSLTRAYPVKVVRKVSPLEYFLLK